jgi:hypothetical protein
VEAEGEVDVGFDVEEGRGTGARGSCSFLGGGGGFRKGLKTLWMKLLIVEDVMERSSFGNVDFGRCDL